MYQSYKMDLAGRPLVVDINRVGKQATDVTFMHYGDTTVLLYRQPLPKKPQRR